MNQFMQSFKSKKFKYGAFSTLTAIFIIAILVVINLVAGQFDLKYDLTKDKRYSISDESKDIIKEVTDEITIYALFKTGQEDVQFKQLLEEYGDNSKYIKIEYKDPYLYPLFVEKYKKNDMEIPTNSVIVESAKRFKVILANEMVSTGYDSQTFQPYIKSIDIEPQVTNAIKYVSEENTSVIYKLIGHSERNLNDAFMKQIVLANYEFKDLDLFAEEKVPEDASILLITPPERDWTADEAEKIRAYLENDGRALFFLDFVNGEFENLRKVLNAYGVDMGNNLVFEGDTQKIFQNRPVNLIPNQKPHDITNPLIEKKYPNLVPYAMSINTIDIKKNSITIEPLFTTSSLAYGKTNLNAASMNKEQGDQDGPFNIAVAVTDSIYTDKQYITKLVVVGSSTMLDQNINEVYVRGSNGDFVLNAINWLHDKSDSVYIRPKSPYDNTMLMIPGFTAGMIMLVSIVIIPLAIFGTGFVVWLRRRNR